MMLDANCSSISGAAQYHLVLWVYDICRRSISVTDAIEKGIHKKL